MYQFMKRVDNISYMPKSMEPDGIGALYLAFEQLKERLEKEGLFNEKWKSPLPRFPNIIGVVTAQTGAAIQDICTTIGRRYPLAEIKLFPAVVQGSGAAPSIVSAIEQANRHGSIDVLIVGRGGGSIEDLWAFNEEEVARAIFSSRIPIISAVGHETDTTIADFVSDKRAPTPTAAAELAVPAQDELVERLLDRKRFLYRFLSQKISTEQKRLDRLQSSYPLQFPERLYRPFTERLVTVEERLVRSGQDITNRDKMAFERITNMLSTYSPMKQIIENKREVMGFSDRLNRTIQHDFRVHSNRFSSTVRMLNALNPLTVMERGYSIVYQEGTIINKVESLQVGMDIDLQLQDGSAIATINSISSKDREEV